MRITRLAAPAVALALAAGVSACSVPASDDETTLRIGASAASVSFDPGSASYADLTVQAVYDSLFGTPGGIGMPGDGGVEPSLATEWSFSDDRTVLTIHLRDDVTFVDDTHFDAEVLKANMDDWMARAWLPGVDEIVVTGDYTVEVHQSKASVLILDYVGVRPVLSAAALENREDLATEPVGSGPYLVDDYVTDASYSFVRNPDYWNAEAFPYDRIEIILLPDVTAQVNALKSGQIDVASIDAATAPDVEAAGFSTTTANSALWAGLYFGDRAGAISPPIGNVKVRQAISMAMDRVGINDAVEGGYGDPSNQQGIPGQDGFYDPGLADLYAYDLEGAKALLAEAGYPDGFDIDIPVTPGSPYMPYYRQAFEDLGIRVNWVDIPADQWLTEVASGKYAVLPFVNYTIGLPQVIERDDFWNPWHYTDAETERLLTILNSGTDEEALDALTAINDKITNEAWFAILSHPPTVVASIEAVDVKLNVLGQLWLLNIAPSE